MKKFLLVAPILMLVSSAYGKDFKNKIEIGAACGPITGNHVYINNTDVSHQYNVTVRKTIIRGSKGHDGESSDSVVRVAAGEHKEYECSTINNIYYSYEVVGEEVFTPKK